MVGGDERTSFLKEPVLAVAISVSLIMGTLAILVLAFGSSGVGIRISEACGSFASGVVAVVAVARIVRRAGRRK